MITTIWDDICYDTETIVMSPINYNLRALNNKLYLNINKKKNKKRKDIKLICEHQNKLMKDENLNLVIRMLFKECEIASITKLDRIYINSFYRKILRAQLELHYLDKELRSGLIVTTYQNSDVDIPLVATLRCLRIICKQLGIKSTTEACSFGIDKILDAGSKFWSIISKKFIDTYGETKIRFIKEEIGEEELLMGVILLLDTIFYYWCGSRIKVKGIFPTVVVNIIPAVFVKRLLPKLKENFTK